MVSTIYVVFGATGEYSDHTEWLIRAYKDKNKAEEHVTNAATRLGEILQLAKNNKKDRYGLGQRWDYVSATWKPQEEQYFNQYDPGMQIDYTGTNYYLEEVELEE